jgi:TonB family protein
LKFTAEIPTQSPSGQSPRRTSSSGNGSYDPQQVPIVLLELQDKLSRSRVREAFWLSVMVHMLAIIAVSTAPHWMPGGYRVNLITPSQMFKNQDQTFLALPPDLQKPTVKPKTDVLSDKDRIASSRHPELNRRDLKRMIDAARPGPPQPSQQTASSAPPPPPAAQQPNPADQRGQSGPQFPQQNQVAKLETLPPGGGSRSNNPFSAAMSPGSAIEQAARATANGRGVGSGTGAGGDFGSGARSNANVQSGLEILSDTQGVDFGPYLERVVFMVRRNWYNVIPEAAMPPILKKGKVSIEFAITRDGKVAGMRLISASGDVSLDRAAWGGITASNPFPPLPTQFTGQYLALRFHFFYNPGRNDIQ